MSSATNRNKGLLELTPSQSLALETLDSGGTHQEAAEAAGVARTTVSRWATRHPAFVAELNRRKLDRAREAEHRNRRITALAARVVETAIESGDARVALQWLRHESSSLQGPSWLPSSAEQVIEHRRKTLPPLDDPMAALEHIGGLTRERAIDAILIDLEAS